MKIGNGHTASFWSDNWSNIQISLVNCVQGYEHLVDEEDKVADYVDQSGEWDKAKLEFWFHSDIVTSIMSEHPPHEERGEDKFTWLPSTDGCFSIRSAYNFLVAGNHQQEDNYWRNLWKWKVPEKMKSFMWLASHNRIHTTQLRARRGINVDARCPFDCEQEEDVMHLLRDCCNAKERWRSMIHPSHWDTFMSLSGKDWIKWNLKKEAGDENTKKVRWAILFGYICWDIWVARCNHLFREDQQSDYKNAYSSLYRACWDQDLVSNCTSHPLRQEGQDDMVNLSGYVRLETDASVLNSGRSGCGGAIIGEQEEWLGGFICKLTSVPPAIAELLGIIHGLHLCWARGLKKVRVVSDCIEAINLILRGYSLNHPYNDIIEEARALIHRHWNVVVYHIPREKISIADRLAKLAHSLTGNYCIIDQPPPPH